MLLRNYILFCLVIISKQDCYCQDVKYIQGSDKYEGGIRRTVIDNDGKLIFKFNKSWISKYEIKNDSLKIIDSAKCMDDSFSNRSWASNTTLAISDSLVATFLFDVKKMQVFVTYLDFNLKVLQTTIIGDTELIRQYEKELFSDIKYFKIKKNDIFINPIWGNSFILSKNYFIRKDGIEFDFTNCKEYKYLTCIIKDSSRYFDNDCIRYGKKGIQFVNNSYIYYPDKIVNMKTNKVTDLMKHNPFHYTYRGYLYYNGGVLFFQDSGLYTMKVD